MKDEFIQIVLDYVEQNNLSLHSFCNELEYERKIKKGVKGVDYLREKGFITFGNRKAFEGLTEECIPERIKSLLDTYWKSSWGDIYTVYYGDVEEMFFIFKFKVKDTSVLKFFVLEFDYRADEMIDLFPDKIFPAAQDITLYLVEKGLL